MKILFLNNYYIFKKFFRNNERVEDLCLTFLMDIKDSNGNHKTIELKPNGANIDVTNSNKNEYIE